MENHQNEVHRIECREKQQQLKSICLAILIESHFIRLRLFCACVEQAKG